MNLPSPATDGVTTTSETFTLSVSDLKINSLAVTLANSGAALAESSSSGTSVGSSEHHQSRERNRLLRTQWNRQQ
jgi:hypothetical protein